MRYFFQVIPSEHEVRFTNLIVALGQYGYTLLHYFGLLHTDLVFGRYGLQLLPV